jgi:hypothetical protein
MRDFLWEAFDSVGRRLLGDWGTPREASATPAMPSQSQEEGQPPHALNKDMMGIDPWIVLPDGPEDEPQLTEPAATAVSVTTQQTPSPPLLPQKDVIPGTLHAAVQQLNAHVGGMRHTSRGSGRGNGR